MMLYTKLLIAAVLSTLAIAQTHACTINQWSAADSVGVTSANVGSPNGAAAIKRYSGICGLVIPGSATAKYVQDNTPVNTSSYGSRFYLFTGADTGAAGYFFLARDGASSNLIRLAITGGVIKTTVANAGPVADIQVVVNQWYAIQLDWQQLAGTFSITVTGAGDPIALTRTSALTFTTAVLKDVRLGLSAASTGTAYFDAYDSILLPGNRQFIDSFEAL
jgi:hypothetical protein